MEKISLFFKKQFKERVEVPEKYFRNKKFDSIVICGMGGSALAGDVIKFLIPNLKIKIPVHVHRTYGLPYQTSNKSLVIAVSYSGDTEEALSAFKESVKRKLTVIAVSKGGELGRQVIRHRASLIQIPEAKYPARLALGFMTSALLKIIAATGIIEDQTKAIFQMTKDLKMNELEIRGKKLAKRFSKKFPLIYSSQRYKALGYLWKICFNENANSHAFSNYFPEMSHNEIEGFDSATHNKFFHAIFLRADDDHPRILKKMNLVSDLLKKRNFTFDFVEIKGKNIYSKIFSVFLLGHWTSYYLALSRKIDPFSAGIIEELKLKMKRVSR